MDSLLCALLSCLRKLVKFSNRERVNFPFQHPVKIVFLPGEANDLDASRMDYAERNVQKGHVWKDRIMNG